MNLVYLPGFNSSPASEKSSLLRKHFPHVIVPEYNTWDPQVSYAQLSALIAPLQAQGLVLAGSSLGGFWAYQFASCHHLPCLLINPCMQPERSLQQYLGKVENYYSGEQGMLTREHLAQYAQYRMPGRPRRITVLHEQGDELIPYQESVQNFVGKARLILPGGGHHRFARTDLIIESLQQLLG
ncbi:YqiA/YcfP family alpha/beta fold hydrolase [Methylobacillus glycogenes]|uniref:YqiA/YcfP family alpha/beta fold hydrolase n=1 Tax=Methylobacillus glycogenes TaxID=406 RepID=UPI000470DB5D|nr:YqiA/YcfP family alpha/beta fold hydrolase [Methylobacillus glycogenes]